MSHAVEILEAVGEVLGVGEVARHLDQQRLHRVPGLERGGASKRQGTEIAKANKKPSFREQARQIARSAYEQKLMPIITTRLISWAPAHSLVNNRLASA